MNNNKNKLNNKKTEFLKLISNPHHVWFPL